MTAVMDRNPETSFISYIHEHRFNCCEVIDGFVLKYDVFDPYLLFLFSVFVQEPFAYGSKGEVVTG
jgi:hypothetical protein